MAGLAQEHEARVAGGLHEGVQVRVRGEREHARRVAGRGENGGGA